MQNFKKEKTKTKQNKTWPVMKLVISQGNHIPLKKISIILLDKLSIVLDILCEHHFTKEQKPNSVLY